MILTQANINAIALSLLLSFCYLLEGCAHSSIQTTPVPEMRNRYLLSIQPLFSNGGRVDWAQDGSGLIAYDQKGEDGYYDVFIYNPATQQSHALTSLHPDLFPKHNGQPAWHPSGRWIVFQAEKTKHEGNSNNSHPGYGVFCDLWVINPQGNHSYNLTNLPNSRDRGALHPHFSYDGKKLSWSQMTNRGGLFPAGSLFGQWALMTADFVMDKQGVPHLENIVSHVPSDPVFYENHGFSPDGRYLIFTSNWLRHVSPLKGNKIYRLDLRTQQTQQLTFDGYCEHAAYSPGGKYIIYGCSFQNSNHGMDYWLMDAGGKNHQRFTFFNQPGFPESTAKPVHAVDMSWNAQGNALVSYVQDDLSKQSGSIYLIHLKKTIDENHQTH
jgi:Tol biopolymer transport system component